MASDDVDQVHRQDGSRLAVGDRICSEGFFGSVRYIGMVPPTKGLWLGVDWDDPTKGKHDGVHENKKYFETRLPSSGSFIRPTKVDLGVPITKALQDRYGLKEGTGGIDADDLFVLDNQFKSTVVEMVGAEKVNKLQSTFNKLIKICFFDMGVYGLGSSRDLGKLCPSVNDLDLSRTLVSSWEDVAHIAGQLPNLQYLNVSENRLVIPKDPQSLASSFSKLRRLTVNKTESSWQQILTCCLMFPSLEELYTSFNNISELSDSIDELKGLKVLGIHANNIQSWNEVLKLGNLPHLEYLYLSENKIKSIYFHDCTATEKSHLFVRLKVLYIKDNDILEWSSIDELNKLKSLEEVEISGNPIMKSFNMETVRQMRIAKMENVKIITRTPVTHEERKGAEIDYLKRFGVEWRKAGGNPDPNMNKPSTEFLAKHPRYKKLIEKWGAPEDSELEEKFKSLKDRLLNVNISSEDHVADRGVVTKKLPGTISVQKLKTLVQRIFRMSNEPILSYVSHKALKGQQFDLDNDMRQLSFYAIESGDTIHVKWS